MKKTEIYIKPALEVIEVDAEVSMLFNSDNEVEVSDERDDWA